LGIKAVSRSVVSFRSRVGILFDRRFLDRWFLDRRLFGWWLFGWWFRRWSLSTESYDFFLKKQIQMEQNIFIL